MRNKYKINILLFSLIIFFSFISNNVQGKTIEKAMANAFYKNPITGAIDDPGNNYGIGQGMVENVVFKEAEIEEDQGRIFAKVKYSMKNYLSNYKIEIFNSDNTYSEVPFNVTSVNDDMDMLEFEIPSKDVLIRAKAFVEPMGREVVFFYNFSNFFVISSDENNNEIVERENKDITLPTKEVKNNDLSSNIVIENTNEKDKFDPKNLSKEHGLLMRNSKEIEDYLNNRNIKKDNNKDNEEKVILGPVTKMFLNGFVIFIEVLLAILFAFAILIKFLAKALEKFNRKLEEKLYDEE